MHDEHVLCLNEEERRESRGDIFPEMTVSLILVFLMFRFVFFLSEEMERALVKFFGAFEAKVCLSFQFFNPNC